MLREFLGSGPRLAAGHLGQGSHRARVWGQKRFQPNMVGLGPFFLGSGVEEVSAAPSPFPECMSFFSYVKCSVCSWAHIRRNHYLFVRDL